MKGFVYIISNKSMPGLIKVGYSTKDPELRARELNNTGSPDPYVVEYEMLIEEPHKIEQQTHRFLFSKCEGKEWFRCSAEEAVAAIKQVAGTRIIHETYKRAERAKAEALYQQELEEQKTRRKREKAKKDVIDRLRNEETTIREKFKRQITVSFPPRPFWQYWLGCGILVAIALSIFYPKRSLVDDIILSSVLVGAIAGYFLQDYFEEQRKGSSLYVALEKQREDELAAVRARAEKDIATITSPARETPSMLPGAAPRREAMDGPSPTAPTQKFSGSYRQFQDERNMRVLKEVRNAVELGILRPKSVQVQLQKFSEDEVEIEKCTQKVEKIMGGILPKADCRKVAIETKIKIITNASRPYAINMITDSYPEIITERMATNIYNALAEP